MATASIPVHVFNPAQAFACIGFLEAADVLLGNAVGGFQWGQSGDFFNLSGDGSENPVRTVLSFLKTAEVKWLSPRRDLSERDGGCTQVVPGIASAADPKAPDLPGILYGNDDDGLEREIPFGYWADGSGRFATTFKKSTNGASSHVRVKNALDAIKRLDLEKAVCDPFNQVDRTESLFRLDPRGVVDPIHGGFSPDSLRKGAKGGIDMRVATYPLCELLAVIGLECTRPERLDGRRFAYSVWDRMLPPLLARAALGGHLGFVSGRRFVVEHVEVKQGGDRKMTDIREELT
jgi:CRISPR-associated protein Csx14